MAMQGRGRGVALLAAQAFSNNDCGTCRTDKSNHSGSPRRYHLTRAPALPAELTSEPAAGLSAGATEIAAHTDRILSPPYRMDNNCQRIPYIRSIVHISLHDRTSKEGRRETYEPWLPHS
jgi:hypothetical protein